MESGKGNGVSGFCRTSNDLRPVQEPGTVERQWQIGEK